MAPSPEDAPPRGHVCKPSVWSARDERERLGPVFDEEDPLDSLFPDDDQGDGGAEGLAESGVGRGGEALGVRRTSVAEERPAGERASGSSSLSRGSKCPSGSGVRGDVLPLSGAAGGPLVVAASPSSAPGSGPASAPASHGPPGKGRPLFRAFGVAVPRPLCYLSDPLDAIRNFSTSFFIMSTTTTLVGTLFAICPYFGPWAIDLGWGFWWLSTGFFITFSVLLAARAWLIGAREVHALAVHRDPDFFFSGLVPIAFSLLVSGVAIFCEHIFGSSGITASISLFWISWSFALVFMVFITFHMAQFSTAELNSVLPLWVLCVMPGAAAASAGGEIGSLGAETHASAARHIMYASLLMLGMTCLQGLFVLSALFQRLMLRGFPAHGIIMSMFFPMAPICILGGAFVEIGTALPLLFPNPARDSNGVAIGSPAISATFVLLGLGAFGCVLWWLPMALCGIFYSVLRHGKMPYTPAWWGAVFPVGLAGVLAFRLAEAFHMQAFKVVGCILAIAAIASWAIIMLCCLSYTYTGRIFVKHGPPRPPPAPKAP